MKAEVLGFQTSYRSLYESQSVQKSDRKILEAPVRKIRRGRSSGRSQIWPIAIFAEFSPTRGCVSARAFFVRKHRLTDLVITDTI